MNASNVFRTSSRDAVVLGAALAHGALLALVVSYATRAAPPPTARAALAVTLGLAMNWNSNTISHIHLHAPIFRGQAANRVFSLYLSLLLGVPQSWWKRRQR